MEQQVKYCERKQIPMVAPLDGVCFNCGKKIKDTKKYYITHCDKCNVSFCE